MQTEQNAKQQVVEQIKRSTNILVTVGRDPSVDALSAALGLTLMLNRLDKHATAVFSGQIPMAINFLDPGKTFENTVDSLRDFIIALDKEKADRLRYKVEDDVVRIFITPYKTVISEQDLQFSQGDFNVELVVALGVENREDLDAAITAHGRILHDANVVTINAGGPASTLGSADWNDGSASSLSEMLMSLSEALQSGLLDQQIATAILTGIVSATDRFRNEHTSPKVMTMAAQLMAAGANQQLIAAKLEEGHDLGPEFPKTPPKGDDQVPLEEGKSQKVDSKSGADGSLEIVHTPQADAEPLPDPSTEALKKAEAELEESLSSQSTPVAADISVEDLQKDLETAAQGVSDAASETQETPIVKPERRSWRSEETNDEPTFGGTLNATVSSAEEEKRREEDARTNRQILSHEAPAASEEPQLRPSMPVIEPLSAPQTPELSIESTGDMALSFEATPVPSPQPTLAEIEQQTKGRAAEDARAAVDAALSAMPFDPANKPLEAAGAGPGLTLDHLEQQVASAQDASAPAPADLPPSLPPLPDFSTLPPLPGEAAATPADQSVPPLVDAQTPPPLPQFENPVDAPPADPGQFKIPGQP